MDFVSIAANKPQQLNPLNPFRRPPQSGRVFAKTLDRAAAAEGLETDHMNDRIAAINESAIAARVAGRKAAEQIKPLLEWPNNHGADFADGFLSQMRHLLPQRAAAVELPEKPQPIARLGATAIPFGQYNGKCFDDVPLDYLDWLCRSQEEFYKVLKAYLKHPELQARRS